MDQSVAATLSSGQPDVSLVLDLDGVILEATLSSHFPSQDLKSWIGRPWLETVADPGSAKVKRIVDDARTTGVSAFRQINQRFPSGLELPIEYTAVRQGRKNLIAVGKSLEAVAELQARLIAAQQAVERDYWKLREVETRCRLLLDRSNEAVLWVRAANLRIVEANPAAIRALGLTPQPAGGVAGRELLTAVAAEDRGAFESMLHRVRDQGKAPGILVRLGKDRSPWLVRSSFLPSQDGLTYLLQLAPAGATRSDDDERVSVEGLLERSPDGFVVLDRAGNIRRANPAFLDLVQLSAEDAVIGEPLGRWLGRPGADAAALLGNLLSHGSVRLYSTTLQGELGSTTEVELAAAGDADTDPRYFGISVRAVASRFSASSAGSVQIGSQLRAFADRIGKTPLRILVREAVAVVERDCIEAALKQTGGNRSAAAQILGLSRQSLYAKLNRYGFEAQAQAPLP